MKRRDRMPPGDASSVLSLLWSWRDHEVRDGMPPGDASSVLPLLWSWRDHEETGWDASWRCIQCAVTAVVMERP